ncbi:MAG: PRC-barrel domain containing protein [Spirulina sp. SIO3F2]|nr:PRC-barrel domain containing protein [Spirulina sp. SIO3F2]
MSIENLRLRSEFINTKVITNDTADVLGVVKDVLVDVNRREVVALGLRDNLLAVTGMPKYMYLDSIKKAGEVLLVPDDEVIEDVDVEIYSNLMRCEVITEGGDLLGHVRDFQFNIQNGEVVSLVLAALGWPQIPEQVLSTYELPVEEIVSTGPNRIIVFEGSEDRLKQVNVGWLERIGIGRAPWERDEEDPYYTPTTAPGNQLGTGLPVNARPVAKPLERPYEPEWQEDNWQQSQPRRKAQSMPYPEPESNWNEPPRREARKPQYEDYDAGRDMWEEDDSYRPQRVNIPQNAKTPEYEEDY